MKRNVQPISSRSSRTSARICACTVTSSAVVGSSATTSDGEPAIAIAIITRWRSPPESSCGIARSCGAPARGRRRRRGATAPPRPIPAASATWRPTRIVGLSDVIGSWNTAPRWSRRTRRRASRRRGSCRRRARRRCPSTCGAGAAGSSPSSDKPSTLLPEPDSPDEAEDLAPGERQVDAAHGVARSASRAPERHLQVADLGHDRRVGGDRVRGGPEGDVPAHRRLAHPADFRSPKRIVNSVGSWWT